ncbi:MAG: GNAT family N-acetyltransferase [Alphaproteobacteria bacterium]|nr:GNAT family N-acetyltransferase [Alphaproteobacteria bacterium]
MKFTGNLTIRPLGPEDAEGFLRVHHAAVHETARGTYAPDILEAWSGPDLKARLAQYLERAKEEIRIGAFDGATMAGLGVIAPQTQELRACYVHPDYGRMGVGAKIVATLEQIAKSMGVESLTLDSSINAEKFYQALGYTIIERTSHKLSDGSFMPAIKMRKILTDAPEIEALKLRNQKVEADKAWETSWTRRLIIAGITYIIVAAWLAALGVGHHLLHAVVPVLGYWVSILTLPLLKKHWIEKIYRKGNKQ